MTKMLKSIIAGAAVLIGACFIGQTQPVQAADDYALRLADDNQWYYYQNDEVDTAYQGLALNEYGCGMYRTVQLTGIIPEWLK